MSDLSFVTKLAGSPWLCGRDHLEFLHGIFLRYLDRAASGRDLDVEAVEKEYGVSLENTREVTYRGGVARIPVEGTIMRRASLFTAMSGGVSTGALMRDFHAAYENPNVRSILFVFDTPGGEAHGIAELAAAIREKRDLGEKPIEAYVDGLCASAGYWLASATERITTDSMGSLGSIGVVTSVRNPKAAGEDAYLEFVSSRSPHKRPNPLTDTGRDVIQAYVDDLGDEFIAAVAANRDVTAKTVEDDFGRGFVLAARRAVEAGMADELGSEEEVLDRLAQGSAVGPARLRPAAVGTGNLAPNAVTTRNVAANTTAINGKTNGKTTSKEAAAMAVRTPQTAADEDQREAAGLLARIGNLLGISVVEAAADDAAPAGERSRDDGSPAAPDPGRSEDAGDGNDEDNDEDDGEESTDDGTDAPSGAGDPSDGSDETETETEDEGEENDHAMTVARTERTSGAGRENGDTATALAAHERAELERYRAQSEADQAEKKALAASVRKNGIAAMIDARVGSIDMGDGRRGAMPKAQRDAAEALIAELAAGGNDPVVIDGGGNASLADSPAGRSVGALLAHWRPQELGERGTVEGEPQTEGPAGDDERVRAELEKKGLGMEHYPAVASELVAKGEIRRDA